MTLFVVGNVTEDIIFRLPHLPAEGETLIANDRVSEIGGKGLNQAIVAARAGMNVSLIAPVGDDAAGRRAQSIVADELPGTVLHRPGPPTDQSIIAVATGGENHIISSAFAASALTQDDVVVALSAIEADDALLVQGNLSRETTLAALQKAASTGARIIANPSPIRWSWAELWPLIDLVILNAPELVTLSGESDIAAGIDALSAAGVSDIVVTLGADGAVHSSDGRSTRVPAQETRVVDTAGAGDTFCGAFIAAERMHCATAALSIAAAAAAISVSRCGTYSAFPRREELANCLALEGKIS